MKFEKKMADTMLLQNLKMDRMSVGEYFRKPMENDLSLNKNDCVGFAPIQRDSIEYWQSVLGLWAWKVMCTPISEMQVLDDLYGDQPGHEFVGVVIDDHLKIANIYNTRHLMKDDIIHELLHVRFQAWTEEEVVVWTKKLNESEDPMSLLSQLEFTPV